MSKVEFIVSVTDVMDLAVAVQDSVEADAVVTDVMDLDVAVQDSVEADAIVTDVIDLGVAVTTFGARVLVYAGKEDGRYGLTIALSDSNATLVKDISTGDVYFIDSVNPETVLRLEDERIAAIQLALV